MTARSDGGGTKAGVGAAFGVVSPAVRSWVSKVRAWVTEF